MMQKRRIPVTISTCYQFVRSSNHKITCSGWCSVCIGTFVIILGHIRFQKMCKCIHDRIHWYTIWRLMECFLQFIANNFDHNEDTTTGACTTHVMGFISSQYPKSDTLLTQPIMKQTITSEKMIDLVNVRGFVKMYEKPSISKFKKTFVKACNPSQLDASLYDILDTFWLLLNSFMDKPPNWQRFMDLGPALALEGKRN